jgi:hypothetical protein
VALIFRTITALQTFDIPYTMTKGGPGNSTETLAMLIHKTTIEYLDVGYGSTLAVCMFVLSLVVTAVYLRRIGRQAHERRLGIEAWLLTAPACGWVPPASGRLNGFFPGAVDPADLAEDRGRTGQQAHHLVAANAHAGQLRAGLHRPAAAALPGQQRGRGAVSTVLSLLVVGAGGLCHRAAEPAHRQLVLTAIVASSMFPLVTLLVPIFETMRTLGLLNTYTALVLPYTVLNLPVCTLVLVSFFQSIPRTWRTPR